MTHEFFHILKPKKNTEGFCIIQVDDNGFCKPVTHNHKGSMYLFTSMEPGELNIFEKFVKIEDLKNLVKNEDFRKFG